MQFRGFTLNSQLLQDPWAACAKLHPLCSNYDIDEAVLNFKKSRVTRVRVTGALQGHCLTADGGV